LLRSLTSPLKEASEDPTHKKQEGDDEHLLPLHSSERKNTSTVTENIGEEPETPVILLPKGKKRT
jgi:hypothetical protein